MCCCECVCVCAIVGECKLLLHTKADVQVKNGKQNWMIDYDLCTQLISDTHTHTYTRHTHTHTRLGSLVPVIRQNTELVLMFYDFIVDE